MVVVVVAAVAKTARGFLLNRSRSHEVLTSMLRSVDRCWAVQPTGLVSRAPSRNTIGKANMFCAGFVVAARKSCVDSKILTSSALSCPKP